MPDLWFVAGLALGMVLMGFVTIGSFDRGADSARSRPWKLELVARKSAYIASRSRHVVATRFVTDLVDLPASAAVIERPSTRPVPAAARRTPIRPTPDEMPAHISL